MEFLPAIPSVKDDVLCKKIMDHCNDLTKPQGSLGRLEEFAQRYCLCRKKHNATIQTMHVFTFAGDHGITEEKITPFPSEVTHQMVMNMALGGAAVSVMCEQAGIGYTVVDIGVRTDFEAMPRLVRKKAGWGTNNFRHGPAMTAEACEKATRIGYEIGCEVQADLIGAGEMGIGNSASASALYSLLLDLKSGDTVGPGTGSSGPLLERKKQVIAESIALHRSEWDHTPFDALCRVGGYEIAGIIGLIFGCASRDIPVVVDGFIASSAALVAMQMQPDVKEYLFFSHESAEPFHASFLNRENIRPIVSLGMRLGEGTGAVIAMQIIAQAMACYSRMATFSSAGVTNKNG